MIQNIGKNEKDIFMSYNSNTSSWKPQMRFDLIIVPLTKISSSSRSTKFKKIL